MTGTRRPAEIAALAITLVALLASLIAFASRGSGSQRSPLSGDARPTRPSATPETAAPSGIHKIKHIIMIMQENRSFDSYFGTFPRADGIPMKNGVPTVCIPDPLIHHCQRP